MTLIRILAFSLVLLLIGGIVFIVRILRIPAHIRKAREYLDNNDLQQAGEIVKKILKKQPDHIPARFIRARILMKQKQYFLSISEMNTILSASDFRHYADEQEIRNFLAEMYHETQQYQKEIDEFKILLTINPNDVNANYRVGLAHYNQRNFSESRDHLVKAYFQDQTLKDCLIPLGVSSYHIADYANAELYLLKSLEAGTTSLDAHYYLGLIYRAKKDPESALKMFTAAKADSRFYISCLYNIGGIFFESEMYDTAIENLEEGLGRVQDKSDESLAYRYLLAECYEMSNKIKEAVYHWEKINEQNSGYRSTNSKLEEYRSILENENRRILFTSSLEELQPLIIEIITRLNYNIITKTPVSSNEYVYKAFNIKRINDPPIMIYFDRTTREVSEARLNDLHSRMTAEKCKSGIYMTTSRFSLKAKNSAPSLGIDLFDAEFMAKSIEKIMAKRTKPGN